MNRCLLKWSDSSLNPGGPPIDKLGLIHLGQPGKGTSQVLFSQFVWTQCEEQQPQRKIRKLITDMVVVFVAE